MTKRRKKTLKAQKNTIQIHNYQIKMSQFINEKLWLKVYKKDVA